MIVQCPHVFTVADQPVDGGEMFALRQFLIQPPKHLYNTQRVGCDGIREISTWRRHAETHTDYSIYYVRPGINKQECSTFSLAAKMIFIFLLRPTPNNFLVCIGFKAHTNELVFLAAPTYQYAPTNFTC